jgi:hypothetical protein
MAKRQSMGKVRSAVRDLREDLLRRTVPAKDRHVHKAALNFLEGIDGVLSAYCLRWSDGANDVLDPAPAHWAVSAAKPKASARKSGAKKAGGSKRRR